MAELFDAVASWPTLFSVLLVFGFAPGFVLRLLVMIYPKEDPRRRELVAELYAMCRLERPMFVAEQLETVLFEGASRRVIGLCFGVKRRFDIKRWRLIDKAISEMIADDCWNAPSIRLEYGKHWYQHRIIRLYGGEPSLLSIEISASSRSRHVAAADLRGSAGLLEARSHRRAR